MRYFKILALALCASLAVVVVSAAAASAEELQVLLCMKVGAGKGKFKDSACKEAETGGEYELEKLGSGVVLSSGTLTSATAVLKGALGDTVTCKGGSLTEGETSGELTGKVTIKFTKCTANTGGNCTTSGAEKGEIVAEHLTTTIKSYKEEEVLKAGILFTIPNPEKPVEFSCAGVIVKVRGSVLAEITNAGELSTLVDFSLLVKEGKQVPNQTTLEASFGGASYESATEEGDGSAVFPSVIDIRP